ncbi:MAG: ribonuclease III [Candidatus Promineifilaceae bacterium]
MDDLKELEVRLGVQFNDYSLLTRAVTHRSYLNENLEQSLEDNERLEFLGDAVLDFVVGAYLYHRYPEMKEGELTMLRAALVRTETLAEFAREVSLGEYLRLGYGEAESGGRDRPAILCGAFEATIGAIFLDKGLPVVEELVTSLIEPALTEILAEAAHKDAKSGFQIWAQGRYNITPRYKVIAAEGPDHAKVFTVAVMLGDEIWGEGTGRSKQNAAQEAAAVALEKAETILDDEELETADEVEGMFPS